MDTPLQRIRNERSLTVAEVARGLGTDKAHYLRLEAGYTKVYRNDKGDPTKVQIMRASPDLAAKIVTYFDGAVSLDEVLFPEKYSPAVLARFNEAQALIPLEAVEQEVAKAS